MWSLCNGVRGLPVALLKATAMMMTAVTSAEREGAMTMVKIVEKERATRTAAKEKMAIVQVNITISFGSRSETIF